VHSNGLLGRESRPPLQATVLLVS